MDRMIIPLNGWAAGERLYRFRAGIEFFQMFDNQEILDADVDAEVRVCKKGERKVEAVLHLQGTVSVPCNRCLEPVDIPIDTTPAEVLTPGEDEVDWDLSQAIYDYTCLAVPIKHVHPEGGCDPDTIRFLCLEERKNEEADATNSPFVALKGLLNE